ncbi:Sodium/hydrogen exchanger [Cystobasidium minutum MCA 4210]|uniref:Sodium/hydrogen exchanger n=1 Tax=Cystobasidium minutum MCA 4210 TaxID=1397322 RepID=UPI0034CF3ACD|eukprot:jgi/Rhomi1/142599/e_gw1.3.541.1
MSTSGGAGFSYTEVDDVSRTLAVFGFYVSVIALASYTLKERLYLSDALIALLLGIAVGPIGWNLVSPSTWMEHDTELTNRLTYELARIVIGIQVLFTGIALPKRYLADAWESLTTLLLLVMTIAWLVSAAFVYALIPGITFLEALCIAACVTPTDPVLANSVVKGRFAEKYIPPHVRNIIAAEAGANDGLGFPFIFLAIYLMARFIDNRSIGQEIGWWIVDVWLYQIALSIAIGAVIGFLAMKSVKFAEQHNMIDHESFLAIGIGLTFLTLGLTGMLGSDDILACFIVGNAFTWDGWFLERTKDETFQDVIDSLLNTGIFIYIGTIMPWAEFGNGEIGLSAWRLVVLAILILLFRRLPWVLLARKIIPDLVTWQEACFAGWFGPIGVGAVYYAQVGLRRVPEDRTLVREIIVPIVYFIVLASVVVHGITIPIFKRTLCLKPFAPWLEVCA